MAEWLESTRTSEGATTPSLASSRYASQVARMLVQREVRDALLFFSRERAWINEQHLTLCRISSPTFFEQKRAEWMAQQLRDYGYESRLDRAGNVVAHDPDATKDGPFVAVTAHLDTVLAPRVPEEITWERDGRFHGPGVADNGAGLAALLAVAKACRIGKLGGPVVFVANVGEEGEGNLSGMRYLCRQSPLADKFRSFLVLDGPTVDHITCQALASRRFEITVTGVGGHSWGDYGIGNPVHALSRAVTLFTDGPAGTECSESRSSLNIGVLEGGSSVNSIPTLARAKVDLRSENITTLDDLTTHLTQAVERAIEVENSRCTGGRVAAKIKEIGTRPGGRLPADAPLLQQLRAVEAHLGIRARLDCASTDANIPLSLGIPAVSIGAGGQGGGAHTPSEWFDPEGREIGLRRILLTLLLLISGPELA